MSTKTSKEKFIPLSVPVIKGNAWDYVKECLDTGWVSTAGGYVNDFEAALATFVGAKYAIACTSGTAALHISLILAGVGINDEVIVPTVTFIAPINTIRYVGADPIFMDCDDYLNIDVVKTKEFIEKECKFKDQKLFNKRSGKQIKAIIPVHVFGHPVDIETLMDLAEKYNLKVIEDATESLGSYYKTGRYQGKKTGTIGHFGCFSFNGNKIITTGGGGVIVTADEKMAEKARYLTTQAKDDAVKYIHHQIGYNYRLTNLQAALGVAQLEQLDQYIKIKRQNFALYQKGFEAIAGLKMIAEPAYGFSNYWFYALLVDKAKFGRGNLELMAVLADCGIQVRPLWYLNHKQQQYQSSQAYKIEKADWYIDRVLNLPCSVDLQQADIERVIKELTF